MKTDRTVLANALAVASGIFYLGCYLVALLFPGLLVLVAKSWMHSVEISQRAVVLTPNSFVVGLVSILVVAWLFGYILGWAIEMFEEKKK